MRSELDEALAAANKSAADAEQLLQDFDRYRLRTKKRLADKQAIASDKLLGDILSFADEFDRAINANITNTPASDALMLLRARLTNLLHTAGLTRLDPSGLFDPAVAEAVAIVGGDVEGQIVEIVTPAYMVGDHLLRPARVVVVGPVIEPPHSLKRPHSARVHRTDFAGVVKSGGYKGRVSTRTNT